MIILTGGAGFIGSCLLARLNASSIDDILIVDHLHNGDIKKQNLQGKSYRDYQDKADFLKLVQNDSLPDKADCVIHMGACSSTLLTDARYYQRNNYEYTCALADWCVKHGIRFIYASSAATYGDGSLGYSDEDAMTLHLKPLNLYGESKHKFDLRVLELGLTDCFVGLKFFNVFGPNEYHKGEMRGVILKAYPRVVEEGEIALFKSYKKEYACGEQKRDFIYVRDAVDVIMFFFENPHIAGIYNVGTGQARSWNDAACSLFQALGKAPHIEYFDMPAAMRDKYQYFTQADVSKLRHSGYQKSFTTLEDAVKDYVGYLKTNKRI